MGNSAFRWTEIEGVQDLGFISNDDQRSKANAVSADGRVVVGWSANEAFRWTASGGIQGLGELSSTALATSADGSVIVGVGDTGLGAFRWTETEGLHALGSSLQTACAVSADGSIVVGGSLSSSVGAFIWDEVNGMRNLESVLENDFGLDLTGWTLKQATGISADGLTIVGLGTNPGGLSEAWIAEVPEPATLLLLSLGAVMLRRKT